MQITRLALQRRNPMIQFMNPLRSKSNAIASQYYKQRPDRGAQLCDLSAAE